MSTKFVILANEQPNDHDLWIKACEENKIDYRVVDLTSYNWLIEIESEPFEMLLAKPTSATSAFKLLYDERVSVLSNYLKYKIYPSLDEILIYENKRFLAYWLSAQKMPHPKTYIFYNKKEAVNYIKNANYPVVAKLNIGASGKGVKIIKYESEAKKYIDKIFNVGVSSRTGPNLSKGKIFERAWRKLINPKALRERIIRYKNVTNDMQKSFCIFQEFIPHKYEWRVVCIGESYFAHKKVVKKEKASGSLIKEYGRPPLYLLDFAKAIMDKFGFYSQAIDLFEISDGNYLINEMQCIFGQSDPNQMIINGSPGRYKYSDGNWIFEEGHFNQNESYNLRVHHALTLLNK